MDAHIVNQAGELRGLGRVALPVATNDRLARHRFGESGRGIFQSRVGVKGRGVKARGFCATDVKWFFFQTRTFKPSPFCRVNSQKRELSIKRFRLLTT